MADGTEKVRLGVGRVQSPSRQMAEAMALEGVWPALREWQARRGRQEIYFKKACAQFQSAPSSVTP